MFLSFFIGLSLQNQGCRLSDPIDGLGISMQYEQQSHLFPLIVSIKAFLRVVI